MEFFPKRQKKFAEKLGKMISAEFLSFEDIEQKITNPREPAETYAHDRRSC